MMNLKNPEIRSTGILPVNTHGQDAHATNLLIAYFSLLIIHCGAAAGRVILVAMP
jgi:hypothetical protein